MIAILGTGLTGAESVSFNGTPVDAFEIASDSEIVTTLPSGATTGTIEVGTTGGSLSSVDRQEFTARCNGCDRPPGGDVYAMGRERRCAGE